MSLTGLICTRASYYSYLLEREGGRERERERRGREGGWRERERGGEGGRDGERERERCHLPDNLTRPAIIMAAAAKELCPLWCMTLHAKGWPDHQTLCKQTAQR